MNPQVTHYKRKISTEIKEVFKKICTPSLKIPHLPPLLIKRSMPKSLK